MQHIFRRRLVDTFPHQEPLSQPSQEPEGQIIMYNILYQVFLCKYVDGAKIRNDPTVAHQPTQAKI